ncbi:hypothetical protein [Roseateles sp. P5_E11]
MSFTQTQARSPTRPFGEGKVRFVDVGRDTAELLTLWLSQVGLEVLASASEAPPDLLFAECAFPRRDERQWLDRISVRWPGAPVILLSPTLFPTVPARGAVANELGVAAVLATPLTEEVLMRTVMEVLGT